MRPLSYTAQASHEASWDRQSGECSGSRANPYRTLKLQFHLDNEHLEALKDELMYGQRLAVDEDDRVLVWTGDPGTTPSAAAPRASPQGQAPLTYTLTPIPDHTSHHLLRERTSISL